MKTKRISKLQILYSNAGFYIGRLCHEEGETQPYSRESSYYKNRADAQSALDNNSYIDNF